MGMRWFLQTSERWSCPSHQASRSSKSCSERVLIYLIPSRPDLCEKTKALQHRDAELRRGMRGGKGRMSRGLGSSRGE